MDDHTNVPALTSDVASKLMAGIAKSQATTVVGAGGTPILRMNRDDGEWIFGQGDEEVQQGSEWVVNVMSLAHGWVCWIDSKIAGQTMRSMMEDAPPRPDPINGKPFEAQRAFTLKCISGDDAGKEVIYKSSSMGGVERVTEFIGVIRSRLLTAHPCPVITLESDWYPNKKYGGKTYKPIFRVVGWADMDGNVAGKATEAITANEASAPVATPVRKRKPPLTAAEPPSTAAQALAEPAPVAQQHVGQRRRPGAR